MSALCWLRHQRGLGALRLSFILLRPALALTLKKRGVEVHDNKPVWVGLSCFGQGIVGRFNIGEQGVPSDLWYLSRAQN